MSTEEAESLQPPSSDLIRSGKCVKPRSVAPSSDPAPAAKQEQTRQPPIRVLLVDDDEIALCAMADLLRKQGAMVEICNDPLLALERANASKPDVALIDMNLPEMGGIELASRLGDSEDGGTPSVLITADTDRDMPLSASRCSNIMGMLYKPLVLEEIADVLPKQRLSSLSAGARKAVPGTPFTALVIEDSEMDRTLIEVLFRRAGLSEIPLIFAESLREGEARLAKERFSHVLLSANIPGATARRATARIRSLAPDSLLLVMTDHVELGPGVGVIRAGADDWFAKQEIRGAAFGQLLRHAEERKQAHLTALEASYTEPRTLLSTSRPFRERMSRQIARAKQSGRPLALLLISVRDFPSVSITLGPAHAEALLRTLGSLLKQLMPDALIGYLESERFAVLTDTTEAELRPLVEHLLEGLCRGLCELASSAIEFRVGAVALRRTRTGVPSAIAAAQEALEQAERKGAAYLIYDEKMAAAAARQRELRESLNHAMAREELSLHYQPKVDLGTGKVNGVEALLRWTRGRTEAISPGEFIPILERTGQIRQFGDWALAHACEQARNWEKAGSPMPIAVNLSARQLHDSDLVGKIQKMLKASGTPARLLQLEVTESCLVHDESEAVRIMRELKDLGVLLAMDDFGVGYSSMNYLRRFPFDYLKIDRSFVRDIEMDETTRAIASAIVTMGHSIGMRIVAEGIETIEQLRILRGMNCDIGQGYYLGRPAPADELNKQLRSL